MSASSQSTIDYLNFVTSQLNRYIPIVFLVLGTIGNISNILVFTRPLLRNNPCSIYFISSSIINFFALYIGLVTPFLGLYNLDPTQRINSLCKIRFYLRYSTITLSTWFILLACIDRYISSSSNINIRLWSSVPLAKRIVCVTGIICFIIPYTQVFYCYTVTSTHVCTYENSICKLLNDVILLICNSGLPPLLMVLISVLTIRNVKYSNRITAGRRRDTQLIRILFIQVFILVLFSIPVAIQKLYTCATDFMVKSPLTTAIESLANQISIEISYISNSTTFYIYSLTSKKYRQEVLHILSLILPYHRNRAIHTNSVHPIERSRLNPNETVVKVNKKLHKSKIQNIDE
jgi:hypothetical protein